MSVRGDLRDALAAAGRPDLSVFAEEPATAPALPAIFLRPGTPYRSPSLVPGCIETWRLEAVALVPIDAVWPLDALDSLVDLARDVIYAYPDARYIGVTQPPAQLTIAGVTQRAAAVTAEIHV
jgi:hypothetical protein